MSTSYRKQSQFELFPGANGPASEPASSGYIKTSLTLTLENIVILCVVIVMSMVISFSLGIEKGKRGMLVKLRGLPPAAAEMAVRENADVVRASLPVSAVAATVKEQAQGLAEAVMDTPAAEENPAWDGPAGQKKSIDKGYTIQVASFKSDKYAQMEADTLKKKGYEIYVVPRGSHQTVCVGNFARREDAQAFSKRLKKKYNDCVIRSL